MMQQERNDQFYITAGFNAFRLGLNSFGCPYPAGDRRAKLWIQGYAAAKNSRVRRFEVSPRTAKLIAKTV